MALTLGDRVKETTTITGTGTATLLGATTGFQSFAVVGNANTTYYCIADQGGANWEVGIGTYVSATPALSRTTVLASSNAGALVSFTAGTKDVFVTYPSEKGVWYDASGNVLFTGTTTAANLAYTGTLTGSTGILNIGSGQVYKDSSGNVGIGSTPSGSYKLEVAGAIASSTGIYLPINQGINTARATDGANITMLRMLTATNTTVLTGGYGALANTTLSFQNVAGTELMVVQGSGNVGIGTTSPAYKLDVRTLVDGVQIFASNGTVTQAVAYCSSGLGLSGTLTNHPSVYITNNAERMRIDTSGNVGIGTTLPTGKLDVAGTIKTLGYTVATLPTGVVGARAYVTDALAPVFGATVVTGGAVTIPVFFNGTNWIVG